MSRTCYINVRHYEPWGGYFLKFVRLFPEAVATIRTASSSPDSGDSSSKSSGARENWKYVTKRKACMGPECKENACEVGSGVERKKLCTRQNHVTPNGPTYTYP